MITEESGRAEVTPESIIAALLISPEVTAPAGLIDRLGLAPALESLRRAEAALAEQNIAFGSQEHIASVIPRPMAAAAQRIIEDLDARLADSDRAVTPSDLLEAFL